MSDNIIYHAVVARPGSKMTSDNLANPAPLGILGFGLATTLLSVHNLGFYGMDSTILAVAVFMGGIAQMIAGVIEFKRNSMFTATVFSFFGLFWMTFAFVNLGAFGETDATSLATLFLAFLILTAVLFICSLKHDRVFKFTFFMLTVTLLALTAGAFTEEEILTRIGGGTGLITGISALYMACAHLLNDQYQKPMLPL